MGHLVYLQCSKNKSTLLSQAAAEWKQIGLLLKIPDGSLDTTEHNHRLAGDALQEVFTKWRRSRCSPYSWRNVLDVLDSDVIDHKRLANEIRQMLEGEDCAWFT